MSTLTTTFSDPRPTLESGPTESERRVAAVPWGALDGLEGALSDPIAEMLAGAAAERVLDRFLRAHRDFSAEQRRASAEALFGVGLWRRRLGAGPPQVLLTRLRTLASAAPPSSWRERYSFPDWLADRLDARFGEEAPLLADALNQPGPVTLRARDEREALAVRLRAAGLDSIPGRWAPQALHLTTPRPNLYGLGPDFTGLFEVQDEGSQLLGGLLGVQPGDEVLDLCAGAGGKSLQLAALAGPQGCVHATDVDLARLDRLRTRAAKAGARVLIHGARPPESLRVAHVLVDAPCSELGALRRGPDLRWRLQPALVEDCAALQRTLLATAVHHLRPGGRLVYATCTLTPEENESMVDFALASFPHLALTRPSLPPALLDDRGCLAVTPHRHGTDGFFAAVFTSRA